MKSVFIYLLVSGLGLIAPLCFAQDDAAPATEEKKIYKQTQPDGTVIFTDKPGPGAEEVKVPKVQSYEPPKTPDFTPYQPARETTARPQAYERFEISSPAHDQALRENTGNVSITVSMSPGLDDGHAIQYLLDGELVQTTAQTSIQLTNVARGTHTIAARIVNRRGEVLANTSATFHLQRTSLLQPGRATPPPPPKPSP